jgi:peptidoglycan biosynthesis protein MviN/MurJ (putative lipid II flippase)
VVNAVLSIILVERLGVVGVAIGTAVPHIIVVGALLPRLLPRWITIDLREYYLSTYVRPLLASVPFLLACLFVARDIRPESFISFFAFGTAALPIYLVPIWLVALTVDERAAVREYVAHRLARPSMGSERISRPS